MTVHTAHHTPTGWIYRDIEIRRAIRGFSFKLDNERHRVPSISDAQSLIDRLLDGPATL